MSNKYKLNPFTGTLDRVLDEADIRAILDEIFIWQDPVATHSALPVIGNLQNTARIVLDEDSLYTWGISNPNGILSDWKLIGPATAIAWGDIIGVLGDQTDLQSELNDKENNLTNTDLEIQDLVNRAHDANTDIGTDSLTFQLDDQSNGVIIKCNSSLTSDLTQPEPTAIGSSFMSPGGPACCVKENAFDDNPASGTVSNGTTQILGWIFAIPTVITHYVIHGRTTNGNYRNWTFEGSFDTTNGFDGTWAVLNTQVNGTGAGDQFGVQFPHNFTNGLAYKAYRFNVTSNWGHVDTGVIELEMKQTIGELEVRDDTDTATGDIKINDLEVVQNLTDGINDLTVQEIRDHIDNVVQATVAENVDIDAGTETVDSFSETLARGVVWEYIVKKDGNIRTGRITAVWDEGTDAINFNEIVTQDIGDTSLLTLDVVMVGGTTVELQATLFSGQIDYRVTAHRNLI